MNEGEGYSAVPSNIQPNIFTQGDYGQENASQHVTNAVLYWYTQGSFQNVNRFTPMSIETGEDQFIFLLREWTS